MKRRKALMLTASLMGTAIVGSNFFLLGCSDSKKQERKELFSKSDILLLDEIGETILPRTSISPGAKDAKVGLFMKSIVTGYYDDNKRNIFIQGIVKLNELTQDLYSLSFIKLEKSEKHDFVVKLDQEASKIMNTETPHFFTLMKQLTIWGYFTSKPGATEALRYVSIPGEFKGCVSYKEGDKAWAL